MLFAQTKEAIDAGQKLLTASGEHGFAALAFTMCFIAVCAFAALMIWKVIIPQSHSRIETRKVMSEVMQNIQVLIAVINERLDGLDDKTSKINHTLGIEYHAKSGSKTNE